MTQYQALAMTLGCEVPIMLLLLRANPMVRVFIVSVAASLISHPFAWYFSLLLSPSEYQIGVVIIEIMVVLFEGLIYWKWLRLSLLRAMSYSAVANIGSYFIGGFILS